MAFSQALQTVTLEAGQDLSAKQYHFMTIASDGQVDPTGDGLIGHGVLQNDPAAAGRPATVAIAGISKVQIGGACTAGSYVAADSSGRAVNVVSGDFALGVALETNSTANAIIPVLLMPGLGKVW